jgi:hypothetical protein
LKERNIKMAVKIFDPKEISSIERDIRFGFDKRLKSEYTLIYEDEFKSGPFQWEIDRLSAKVRKNRDRGEQSGF